MISDGQEYSAFLTALHKARKASTTEEMIKNRKRQRLSARERQHILSKTGSRCHICGGLIDGEWDADHVLSHSKGGEHSVENYLPAHKTCNNYRWHYLAEEFQEIMKLGVWVRTQIERNTKIGNQAAEKYVRYEMQRVARRKTTNNT